MSAIQFVHLGEWPLLPYWRRGLLFFASRVFRWRKGICAACGFHRTVEGGHACLMCGAHREDGMTFCEMRMEFVP